MKMKNSAAQMRTTSPFCHPSEQSVMVFTTQRIMKVLGPISLKKDQIDTYDACKD